PEVGDRAGVGGAPPVEALEHALHVVQEVRAVVPRRALVEGIPPLRTRRGEVRATRERRGGPPVDERAGPPGALPPPALWPRAHTAIRSARACASGGPGPSSVIASRLRFGPNEALFAATGGRGNEPPFRSCFQPT